MKNWLIPAIALLAIGGAGIGVGWFANEWRGGGGASAPRQQPTSPVNLEEVAPETPVDAGPVLSDRERDCATRQAVLAQAFARESELELELGIDLQVPEEYAKAAHEACHYLPEFQDCHNRGHRNCN